MAMELEGAINADPWEMSPHQLMFRILFHREQQRSQMVRAAVAAGVKNMKAADQKKWFRENGGGD